MAPRGVLVGRRGAIVILSMVIVAVLWRCTRPHLGLPPNLEPITASALVMAAFAPRGIATVAPLIAVMASDAILGVSQIMVFTWSAWIAAFALFWLVRRVPTARLPLASGAFAILSSLGFFAWTNFGVWAVGAGTYYPADLAGLGESYVAGLPFLRTMLLGNLVLAPLAVGVAGYLLLPRSSSSLMLSTTDSIGRSSTLTHSPRHP